MKQLALFLYLVAVLALTLFLLDSGIGSTFKTIAVGIVALAGAIIAAVLRVGDRSAESPSRQSNNPDLDPPPTRTEAAGREDS